VTVLALPVLPTPPHEGSQRLNAAQVRILELQSRSLEDALSGSVTHLDAVARTLSLMACGWTTRRRRSRPP